MRLSPRVDKWLEELHTGTPKRRDIASKNLSSLSEHYFSDRKVPVSVRDELVEELHSLRDDEQVEVRKCVAQLVGLAKHQSIQAEELLMHLLTDIDPGVRSTTAWACGFIGKASQQLWQSLVSCTGDAERDVRWRVVWALQEIRPAQKVDDGMLLRLFDDSVDLVRLYGIKLASRCVPCPSAAIVEAISAALDKVDSGTVQACDAIAAMSADWDHVRPRLISLVLSEYHGVQAGAVRALLARFPGSRDWPEVSKWIADNPGYWWTQDR